MRCHCPEDDVASASVSSVVSNVVRVAAFVRGHINAATPPTVNNMYANQWATTVMESTE